MASPQDTTKATPATGTSTPSQQDTRHTDEERHRTSGPNQGTGAQLRDRAHETGTQMRDRAQEAGTQVADRAQDMGTQMRHAAQDMGTQVRHAAQDIGAQAQNLGTQVKEAASEYYEQGRESLQEWNQSLEAQIRQKPMQSLLIAGGIGLLIGLLWRRS